MTVQKFTIPGVGDGKDFSLYAEPANLNYFLKTPLTPDVQKGVVDKEVVVKSGPVAQYPGDTSMYNRPATVRRVLVDPSRKSGAGLPGRSITLVGDPGMLNQERRTFTLQGAWIDFHAWLSLNAKMEIYAFNKSGARYTINAATTSGTP